MRMASELDDMVSLQTRASYKYGICYDRPTRMGISERDEKKKLNELMTDYINI